MAQNTALSQSRHQYSKILKQINEPEQLRTVKSRTTYLNNLQLFNSAVDELIKGLRTRRCVRFDVNIWMCTDGVHSNESFIIFILLVQRQLSGTVSLKSWTPQSNVLRPLCIHTDWRKRNKFICKRITREYYSYHYCRTQRRCPGSIANL